MKIEKRLISDLKFSEYNPRKATKEQEEQLRKSLVKFGCVEPILVNENPDRFNVIIGGHFRVRELKKLGIKEVDCVIVNLSLNDEKELNIRLNANTGDWDLDLLKLNFDDLNLCDWGLDLEALDFSICEDKNAEEEIIQDEIPVISEETDPITKTGDIWILGRHRLMCGDSTNIQDVSKLMAMEKADMIFTDPPYNLSIQQISKKGLDKYRHKDFVNASGEMTSSEFSEFLEKIIKNLLAQSKENSIHYICMDWRHILELLIPGKKLYKKYKNMCVWNKDTQGLGRLYTNKHELIFVFQNGEGKYTCNFKFCERSNVWDYPSIVSFANNKPKLQDDGKIKSGENEEVKMHPTVKPLKLVADAILDCSNTNELILDLFGGSGTTLIASEETNRTAYLMELERKYCDVIIKRWQNLTRSEAIREDGVKFKEL